MTSFGALAIIHFKWTASLQETHTKDKTGLKKNQMFCQNTSVLNTQLYLNF